MADATQFGSFVPTTQVWDVGQFMDVDVKSKEFKELLVRLYQNVNLIANVINTKDSGYYDTATFVNGQLYFPNPAAPGTASQSSNFRQVYRKVFDMGALDNAGLTTKLHGITCDANTTFTRIYGVATNPVAPYSYIPLPYVGAAGGSIELNVDGTRINIITTDDKTAYTRCYVVVEYLLY